MIFGDYARRSGPDLARLAFLLTRDAHLAVLLDVYRKWHQVQGADDVEAYVRRMTVNTYLAWTRRRSRLERPQHFGAKSAYQAGDRLLVSGVRPGDVPATRRCEIVALQRTRDYDADTSAEWWEALANR